MLSSVEVHEEPLKQAPSKAVRFAEENESAEFQTGVRYTPKMTHLATVQYRDVEARQQAVTPLPLQGSLSKPNYEDILKRVSIVITQHVQNCEERLRRLTPETRETGLFHSSQMEKFSEEHFVSPQYVVCFVRAPLVQLGLACTVRAVPPVYTVPQVEEVHRFVSDLFLRAQLSAECSIVCLIYVERLMEAANVPLCASTWRPCLLCGLLLASKVWQDLSSWNSEFASIYPQFSLHAINRLEGEA